MSPMLKLTVSLVASVTGSMTALLGLRLRRSGGVVVEMKKPARHQRGNAVPTRESLAGSTSVSRRPVVVSGGHAGRGRDYSDAVWVTRSRWSDPAPRDPHRGALPAHQH